MVKVLALLGSPRLGENTDTLCEAVLQGVRSQRATAEKIPVAKLRFSPCVACNGCYKEGRCIIEDDYQALYDKYNRADCIIVATPIYFHSVTAQMKAAIDRSQALWASKYVVGKPLIDRRKLRLGLFLATGGAPETENAFGPAKDVVQTFFRAINTHYWNDLLVPNTDVTPVRLRSKVLDEAFHLGQQLVQTYKKFS